MIITEVRDKVNLRWRDDNNERLTETIDNFRHYFYVESKDFNRLQNLYTYRHWGQEKLLRPRYEQTTVKNLNGDPLIKVTIGSRNEMYWLKDQMHRCAIRTYEADISLARKYCVDKMDSIHTYNLRKWYLDIETTSGRDYKQINAITVYDSYTKLYTVYTWFPDKEHQNSLKNEWVDENIELHIFESEKLMLRAFLRQCIQQDPDMIIGWYVLGFDIPVIIQNMCSNNINARKLSPYNEVTGVYTDLSKAPRTQYTNTAQPIKGRISYCLMTRFERLWLDSQRGTLPSLSLEYCSKALLGEDAGGKVKKSKFEGDEFFRRAWLEDTDVFLEYNYVDVKLMVEMDEKMRISENDLALQRLLICPFECVFYNSQMGAAYFMKHASWKAPTGVKGNKEKYEAAFVMDPDFENTYGLHSNVAVFDFKSLYPSMMAANNISWETKQIKGGDDCHNIYFGTPKNLGEFNREEAQCNVGFKKEPLGLLPECVIGLMKMRDEYKKELKAAKSDEDRRMWDSAQLATKRVVNALYGVLAKDGYGWGDMEMAAAITASARYAMRSAAFEAQRLGYEVIYGHTDSIFVLAKNPEESQELCGKLNAHLKTTVFNDFVTLEFEKFAKSFFLSKKKNRYCGYLSWKDGEYLDEENFFMMGFEAKKSNETAFAKNVQLTTLKMVASGKLENEVTKFNKERYNLLKSGEVDMSTIAKRSRLRQELTDYKVLAGGVAGVAVYNSGTGTISVGDSYYFYRCDNRSVKKARTFMVGERIRQVDYIACKRIDEVISDYPPDWLSLAESEVVKKVTLIYDSLGWDLLNISEQGTQTTIAEWW